jgi:hypothetical protein
MPPKKKMSTAARLSANPLSNRKSVANGSLASPSRTNRRRSSTRTSSLLSSASTAPVGRTRVNIVAPVTDWESSAASEDSFTEDSAASFRFDDWATDDAGFEEGGDPRTWYASQGTQVQTPDLAGESARSRSASPQAGARPVAAAYDELYSVPLADHRAKRAQLLDDGAHAGDDDDEALRAEVGASPRARPAAGQGSPMKRSGHNVYTVGHAVAGPEAGDVVQQRRRVEKVTMTEVRCITAVTRFAVPESDLAALEDNNASRSTFRRKGSGVAPGGSLSVGPRASQPAGSPSASATAVALATRGAKHRGSVLEASVASPAAQRASAAKRASSVAPKHKASVAPSGVAGVHASLAVPKRKKPSVSTRLPVVRKPSSIQPDKPAAAAAAAAVAGEDEPAVVEWLDGIGNIACKQPLWKVKPKPLAPVVTLATPDQAAEAEAAAAAAAVVDGDGPTEEADAELMAAIAEDMKTSGVDLDRAVTPPVVAAAPTNWSGTAAPTPQPVAAAAAQRVQTVNPYEVEERRLPPLPTRCRVISARMHTQVPDQADIEVLSDDDGDADGADGAVDEVGDDDDDAGNELDTSIADQEVTSAIDAAVAARRDEYEYDHDHDAQDEDPSSPMVPQAPAGQRSIPQDGYHPWAAINFGYDVNRQFSVQRERIAVPKQHQPPPRNQPSHTGRGESPSARGGPHPPSTARTGQPAPALALTARKPLTSKEPTPREMARAAKAVLVEREKEFAKLFPDWSAPDDRLRVKNTATPKPLAALSRKN